jgi:uncharacterized protein YndB with AHSA1/START domain
MLGMITIVVLLLLATLLVLAASRPSEFSIARTTSVAAPPEKIFPLINDLRQMNTWMPFVNPDPNIQLTYSGPASGKGAANDFSGNNQVGAGRVEIIDSIPPSKIAMRLLMTRPMACDNKVEFALVPNGRTTTVTWTMSGKNSFLSKLMCLVLDPDKMVGGQFEKGLVDLKALAEK